MDKPPPYHHSSGYNTTRRTLMLSFVNCLFKKPIYGIKLTTVQVSAPYS